MKNIPTKIYLQLGPQAPDETDDFNEASKDGAVSWCADKVDGHDIEYIHKDAAQMIFDGLIAENKRLLDLIEIVRRYAAVEYSESVSCRVIASEIQQIIPK